MADEPKDLFSLVPNQPSDSPKPTTAEPREPPPKQETAPETVTTPTQQPAPAVSKEVLLERLRKGQAALIKLRSELWLMPQSGMGSEKEQKYLDGVDLWVKLEKDLREGHLYKGCVMEAGHCDPAAVVKCVWCAVDDMAPKREG